MDPRIKVGLKALTLLENLKKNSKVKINLKDIRAILMSCQWVSELPYLKHETEKLKKPIEYKCNNSEEPIVRWSIGILNHLSDKFRRGEGSSILLGLDCALGTILSTKEVSGKLTVCRVDSSLGMFTVVTNLDVKKERIHPFVVLPPQEIGGILSTAMFVWGPVTSLSEVDWKKVEGEISASLA